MTALVEEDGLSRGIAVTDCLAPMYGRIIVQDGLVDASTTLYT